MVSTATDGGGRAAAKTEEVNMELSIVYWCFLAPFYGFQRDFVSLDSLI